MSFVELMFRYPGNGTFGGALATRLPHVNPGTIEIRVPSQIGGFTAFSALTA